MKQNILFEGTYNEQKEKVQSRNILGMMPLDSAKSDAAIKVSKVL